MDKQTEGRGRHRKGEEEGGRISNEQQQRNRITDGMRERRIE